jgi:hypothetical protein
VRRPVVRRRTRAGSVARPPPSNPRTHRGEGHPTSRLGAGTVAVRSSAMAKDLPKASFVGQHDTFRPSGPTEMDLPCGSGGSCSHMGAGRTSHYAYRCTSPPPRSSVRGYRRPGWRGLPGRRRGEPAAPGGRPLFNAAPPLRSNAAAGLTHAQVGG